MEQVIKVVVKEVGKAPKIKVINNNLEAFKEIVAGSIEVVTLPFSNNIFLVCNDIGKLANLPFNFYDALLADIIVGNVFFVSACNDEFISLTEQQIDNIERYLHNLTLWI